MQTLKTVSPWAYALGIAFALAILMFTGTGGAQSVKVEPTPTPSPTPVSDEDNRVEVIDLSNLENRVRELHKHGVAVNVNDIIPMGDDKIILITGTSYAEE